MAPLYFIMHYTRKSLLSWQPVIEKIPPVYSLSVATPHLSINFDVIHSFWHNLCLNLLISSVIYISNIFPTTFDGDMVGKTILQIGIFMIKH